MIKRLKKHFRTPTVLVGVPSAEDIVNVTHGIRFKANLVSKTMDVANGGYWKHGGYHRLYGGHSVSDWSLWRRFGHKFSVELGKDVLTRSGLPLPGVETALNKGWITLKTADTWGALNIGDLAAGGIGLLDSGRNVWRFSRSSEDFEKRSNGVLLKGGFKLAVGASHCNVLLIAAGSADLGMGLFSKARTIARFDYQSPFGFGLQEI